MDIRPRMKNLRGKETTPRCARPYRGIIIAYFVRFVKGFWENIFCGYGRKKVFWGRVVCGFCDRGAFSPLPPCLRRGGHWPPDMRPQNLFRASARAGQGGPSQAPKFPLPCTHPSLAASTAHGDCRVSLVPNHGAAVHIIRQRRQRLNTNRESISPARRRA